MKIQYQSTFSLITRLGVYCRPPTMLLTTLLMSSHVMAWRAASLSSKNEWSLQPNVTAPHCSCTSFYIPDCFLASLACIPQALLKHALLPQTGAYLVHTSSQSGSSGSATGAGKRGGGACTCRDGRRGMYMQRWKERHVHAEMPGGACACRDASMPWTVSYQQSHVYCKLLRSYRGAVFVAPCISD